MNEASEAPATSSGTPVTQPNINVGASTMLMTTVTIWMSVGIFKSPIPRSAAPMATSGNCRTSAGTNQPRYRALCAAVAASADSHALYACRVANAMRQNAMPTTLDSTSA